MNGAYEHYHLDDTNYPMAEWDLMDPAGSVQGTYDDYENAVDAMSLANTVYVLAYNKGYIDGFGDRVRLETDYDD